VADSIVISGSGLYHPEHIITNEQLVEAYNGWATKFNSDNAAAIEAGDVETKPFSSAEFIEKASGIKQRYAMFPDGILDIDRMMPRVPKRPSEELSEMAELGIKAAKQAMEQAGKKPEDIDLVICAVSTMQRPWPALAVEIQKELGCKGYAFDMSVACSSATFGASTAMDSVLSGMSKCALVISPELTTPQMNFRDRDSHFIFGDVATAMVIEKEATATSKHAFRVLDRKLMTEFSNNIRSNFGYLTRTDTNDDPARYMEPDQFFVQYGRKVFKELLPMVCNLIEGQLSAMGIGAADLKRMWLHQANINMNTFATKKLLGREPEPDEAPIVLDEYANTASAGSVITFHKYKDDFKSGDKGILCSFGAGYSVGSLILEKV